MLAVVGISETEERAYRTLIGHGAASPADLADSLGLDENSADAALRLLEARGLAARTNRAKYAAAPPTAALGALLARHRKELRQAEMSVASLDEQYRSGHVKDDLVEVVVGKAAIRDRFEAIQTGAASEVLALVSGSPTVMEGAENRAEDRAVARGVKYRVVLERDAVAGHRVEAVANAIHQGEQVRVVDAVPTRLLIADRATALVPLAEPRADRVAESSALVIRAGELVRSLTELFERVWRDAIPIRLDADDTVVNGPAVPDATDIKILSMLLAGLTDAAIARQLALSSRTVQRRVARMMELTGAVTRLQLGWHAAHRNWLNG